MFKHIVPNAGDIVEYHILSVSNNRNHGIVKVLRVHLFRDIYNQIQTLVTIDEPELTNSVDNSRRRCIHTSHITRIVKLNPATPRSLNIYRDEKILSEYRSLSEVVFHILSSEQVRILRPLNTYAIHRLYDKNGIGLDMTFGFCKIRNRKKFKRWVMSNWTKMMYSKKEWNQIVKKGKDDHEKDYRADLDYINELEENWDDF